jgi:hypothetical protein
LSVSGAQAAAFFREVARRRVVWWVRDDEGAPTWPSSTGDGRTVPYWSSEARANRAVAIWGAGLRTVSMPLRRWRVVELPGLAPEGLRVGINWSGPRLTGWDFTVDEALNRLAHALGEPPYDGGADR